MKFNPTDALAAEGIISIRDHFSTTPIFKKTVLLSREGLTAKLKRVFTDSLDQMTLPKGYGTGGRKEGGGRDEYEKMIGHRVESGFWRRIYIFGFALCWAATAGGVYVGVTIYPWAYPLPSGIYALSVLTVIEALGFFFIMKITGERLHRP